MKRAVHTRAGKIRVRNKAWQLKKRRSPGGLWLEAWALAGPRRRYLTLQVVLGAVPNLKVPVPAKPCHSTETMQVSVAAARAAGSE